MGIADAAQPACETSVSFGRFDKDSLSWEKWSSFSPNKYLEEVEKCSTPGSVASKKAYFEAHYKKVAAKKAESQSLLNCADDDSARSDEDSNIDLASKSTETEPDTSISDVLTKVDGIGEKLEDKLMDEASESKHQDALLVTDCKELIKEEVKLEEDTILGRPNLCKVDTSALVEKVEDSALKFDEVEEISNIEIIPIESVMLDEVEAQILDKQISVETTNRHVKEVKTSPRAKTLIGQPEVKKELPKQLRGKVNRKKENVVKSAITNVSKKTGPTSKTQEVARLKQTPLVTGTKAPQMPNSKLTKPVRNPAQLTKPVRNPAQLTKPVRNPAQLTTPSSSAKKLSASSNPINNASCAVRDDHVTVKSLHLSICLDERSSDTKHLPTARNSLIMERMKDKDIIKRAFKTFQQSIDKPIEARVSPAFSRRVEPRSTSIASQKEEGRSVEKRTTKVEYFPIQSGSDTKERQIRCKSEEKPISKTPGSLLSASRGRRETDVQLVRQSLNFKATPLPGFYQANKGKRKPLDKESSKAIGM